MNLPRDDRPFPQDDPSPQGTPSPHKGPVRYEDSAPHDDAAVDPAESLRHLSQIDTLWSMVRDGQTAGPNAADAQRRLLNRYGGSVRRYLHASLRDPDAAEEVYQEFALRLVRGDFRTADETRGRFRSYVKSVLYRMMIDHHRGQARRRDQTSLQHDPEGRCQPDWVPEMDRVFLTSWREELLTQAWSSLAEAEGNGGPPYHTALRLRVDHPDWSSDELAWQLSQRLARRLQPGAARVMIHRARERFSDTLIRAVADSLGDASYDAIEEELLDLNLMTYCRAALDRYRDQ